jgi:dihydroorotate dehydrogenase
MKVSAALSAGDAWLLRRLPPETAHAVSTFALKHHLTQGRGPVSTRRLATNVAGLDWPNPLGVAAGFDKGAQAYSGLLRLGFGFVEVGAITPRPQAGQARPRLFRLLRERALINRLGFNNPGVEAVAPRLMSPRAPDGLIGLNLGANKDTADKAADFAAVARRLSPLVDYLTLNVSSPNTPGLRDLQAPEEVHRLVTRLMDDPSCLSGKALFLKLAPDMETDHLHALIDVAHDLRLTGLVLTNTTLERRRDLDSAYKYEPGGLSGAPLKERAEAMMRAARAYSRSLALIGSGGIMTADDAYARIRAGADLVQVYTGLIYTGPALAQLWLPALEARLTEDGFASVGEAVGVDA